jgi:group I intron endonuclease
MYKVYCWTNQLNNKRYVGLTSQTIQSRAGARMHYYKGCPHFWSAIQKYGHESFTCTILKADLTIKQAEYYERYYIRKYKTCDPQYGYNVDEGGLTYHTSKSKAKQSRKLKKALKNSPRMQAYLKTLSVRMKTYSKDPAVQKKLSAGLKRMWQDPEVYAKRTAIIRSNWADPQKKAAMLAKRNQTMKQAGPFKPVRIYCHETDTTYDMIADAERALGFHIQTAMNRAKKHGIKTFTVGQRSGTPYTITRLDDWQ